MNTQKPVLQTTTAFYYRVKDCEKVFTQNWIYMTKKLGRGEMDD